MKHHDLPARLGSASCVPTSTFSGAAGAAATSVASFASLASAKPARASWIVAILWLAAAPTLGAQSLWSEGYQHAAVSSAERHASEIGVEILRQGGNAIDAAVAVQFALAVTYPVAGNIGGGGFMVVRMKDGEAYALDYREKAPGSATRDMYLDEGEIREGASLIGHLASGVPGTVDGMIRALERLGRLPLETVIEPAIRLARDGYRLSESQAESMNYAAETFSRFEGSKAVFVRADGRPWEKGDLFVQADLAATLERIAREGRRGFYEGLTASLVVEEMRKGGGIISAQDMASYESVWRDPIRTSFAGNDLLIMPPPSSGGIVISHILSMLSSLESLPSESNSAATIHMVSEMMTRSFADRAHHMGDPDFVDMPTDSLLSPSYAARRFSTFDPARHTPSSELTHGTFATVDESFETTHFSVVDEEGNAVAVTTTLNGGFGSHVTVTGAGFLLNNEMDDFSIKPGSPNMFGLVGAEANAIAPGKRMLSSMSPLIASRDGKPVLINGAAGGPRIITSVLLTTLNILHYGMNAQEAISAPRFHHQWLPDRLFYERNGMSADTRMALEQRGHDLLPVTGLARVHLIAIDEDGMIRGAADPRGNGHVAGY
jgi:gamma-glutamyltranspeptidase/glutathione hydrolase